MKAERRDIVGPREGDRHIFPRTTLDNLRTGRCTSREFAGKMSQSPTRERLPFILLKPKPTMEPTHVQHS